MFCQKIIQNITVNKRSAEGTLKNEETIKAKDNTVFDHKEAFFSKTSNQELPLNLPTTHCKSTEDSAEQGIKKSISKMEKNKGNEQGIIEEIDQKSFQSTLRLNHAATLKNKHHHQDSKIK